MNDTRIREFLADTLALWRVSGTVETAEAPVVAIIRTEQRDAIFIESYAVHPSTSLRYAQGERGAPPFRWIVRTDRPRPCASLVGLLSALRGALGVERGSPVRVAPAPSVRPERSGSEVEG